ncbi:hypothetical protein TUMEXPCC7403_15675 [Tumidithrix helvetica PCC 7403]|uniref:hypothetical protein n=1 Tax=Tumidithrix helvetica TaxID=3457545 RepID=UPI003CBED27E
MICLTVFFGVIFAVIVLSTLIIKEELLFPYTDIGGFYEHAVNIDVLGASIGLSIIGISISLFFLLFLFFSANFKPSAKHKKIIFSMPMLILSFQLLYLSYTLIGLFQLYSSLVPCGKGVNENQNCYYDSKINFQKGR